MKKLLLLITLFTFHTHHSFGQWTQLPNLPVTGTVWDIYFVNANTGWVTLVTPTGIIKTTNSGINWIIQSNISIRNIQFLDDNTGYGQGFTGTNGTLWKTTDGGANWSGLQINPNIYVDICFINKDTGWVCGQNGNSMRRIWMTTNGGASLQIQNNIGGGGFERIFMLKEKINGEYWGWCYAGLNLLRTTNSGINWVQIATLNGACGSIQDMYFKDSSNGIVTRGLFCFSKTTNGGYNWIDINEDNILQARIAVIGNTGWLTLSTDTVIKTNNFFQTYGRQPVPISVNKIFAVDSNIVYGGYNQNSIIKTTNGGGNYVSVTQISSEVPEEYSLSQNYPNPFNPNTNIKYQIPNSSIVLLKVYDVLGKEIQKLVNQKQAAGTYEVRWDASNYPSGIYIYKLTAGGYTETKKAVLIK